jgi:hypothetical protein
LFSAANFMNAAGVKYSFSRNAYTAAGSRHLLLCSLSESESELLYEWRFTANQFVLATCPFTLTTTIYFQLNTCFHSPYVTSSLTRGWVCSSQLLLALASAVILRSDSRGTRDHILLSEILNILKYGSYLRENTLTSKSTIRPVWKCVVLSCW